MKIYKKPALLILGALISTGSVTLASLDYQTSAGTSRTKAQRAVQPQYPITDYVTSESSDPKEQRLRKAKNARYDGGKPLSELTNLPPTLLELPLSHAPAEPALPIHQSDLVMIGTVTNGQAFLSNDKSNLYSEFTVQVEEVLKNCSPVSLSTGNTIVAERRGGAVRLPSGLIHQRGILGRGVPRTGNRYILFLKYNSEVGDFTILTGYEAKAGEIVPLDGLSDQNFDIYKNYKLHSGTEERNFLNALRSSIGSSISGKQNQ